MIAFLAAAALAVLPNPLTTPGALNPHVTQANIHRTICRKGWTATIRPPLSYTDKLKRQQLTAMGLTIDPLSVEEDHLISLEIGGSPTSPDNLWPQKWADPCGAKEKDRIETAMKALVCSGQITLSLAQHEIATDWTAAYAAHIGPLQCGVALK